MITSVAGNDVSASGSVDSEIKKTLGQEDFMRLLVTQLQYQDPLKPMENTEFISQMSQFSSLDQLYSINSGLQSLTAIQGDINSKQAVSFLGKEVKVTGNKLYMDGDNKTTGMGYQLTDDASEVVIQIFNEDGKLVSRIEPGSQTAGYHTEVWDGKDYSGNVMSPGEYTFSVNAKDVNGKEIYIISNIVGVADGVSFENDVPYLTIQGIKMPVSDIEEVKEVKLQ